jgi:hypothetical protein
MDDERYKDAILSVCQAVERPALAEPPLPEFDLGEAEVCPHCGGLNVLISEEEDCETANCHDCCASFTPKVEALSRRVIRRISERHNKRLRGTSRMITVNERLERNPPPGIDPVDYTCFRMVFDRLGLADGYSAPDVEEKLEATLLAIKERFIAEKVSGYIHPQNGEEVPQMSREEAEAAWALAEPRYREFIINHRPNAEIGQKLGLGDVVKKVAYQPAMAQ